MKKSGSITVFTSLFLAVFLLVFQVLLQSVQIGGGRVQAETGVEEGLYSVFAGYDRELLERYHVFMVDGSYGTGVWKPERMYQTVKKCMEESCRPDEHGRGYRAQAVDYMKETLGIQGIQLLMKKYEQQKDIFEQQEKRGSDIDVKQSMDSYEKARKEAGQNQGQDPDNTGQQPAVVQVPADFVNPLDVIRQLQKKSILALVVPAGKELSQKGQADRYGDTVLWGAGGYGSDKRDFSGVYDAASYGLYQYGACDRPVAVPAGVCDWWKEHRSGKSESGGIPSSGSQGSCQYDVSFTGSDQTGRDS